MGKMSYGDYAKAKKGQGMSYEDYMKACDKGGLEAMSKAEYEDAEQEGYDEDEDTEKSEVDANDLLKAISDYATVEEALNKSGTSREAYLTERFREGTISKAEQTELGELWASGRTGKGGENIRKSLGDRIEDADPDASGLIDASDFLKSLVDQTDSALDDIGARVERDGNATRNLLHAQGQLLKSTAMVLAGQDQLIKSQQVVINEMGRRLGVLESQPVVRKSQGADPRDVRPRDVGGTGGRGGGKRSDQLSKSQVQQGLRSLMQKAADSNDEASIDRLTHATALYESTGAVHPNIAGAIRLELGLTQ